MPGWNFADCWEIVAETIPDAPALYHGPLERSWAEFDARADALAAAMLRAGLTESGTVAQYLHNGPEYLESTYAAFKLGVPPVNTNYRYVDDELLYLWDNADAEIISFAGEFTETVDRIREKLPRVKAWFWVDDGSGPCPDWATAVDTLPAAPRTAAPWGRSGDSLYLLYTGGTTGMPKGVMWRVDDLLLNLNVGAPSKRALPDEVDHDHLRSVVATPGHVTLPACPLMHGTGAFNAFTALTVGGSVVTLEGHRFDPVELLDAIEHRRVGNIAIVGDAFGRPILRELDAHPGRWDLSSLRVILSSGVMWSKEIKEGLLRHNERMLLVDSLGSSEATTMATSVSTGGSAQKTATFALTDSTKVITEDGRFVEPGSDDIGKLALRGRVPVGYYKDPVKSAETFVEVQGERFSMPGDFARVNADGTLELLGRGSVCINTGGEKVFPEEVEEALKTHDAVHDAITVGVPDERFGQAITSVVQLEPAATIDGADLIAHVKGRLAHYKAPKQVLFADDLARAANGKIDYKRWTAFARSELGID